MSQLNNITASSGNTSSTIQVKRPSFKSLWDAYKIVGKNVSAEDVYTLHVGGYAKKMYEHGQKIGSSNFENSCAMRLSYAFNKGVFTVPSKVNIFPNPDDVERWRGKDGKAYIIKANDMIRWIKKEFGNPELEVETHGKDISSQLFNKKGIIVFIVDGWDNATGHVTLWNGNECGDHCYFTHPISPVGYNQIKTTKVLLWELK